MTLDVYLDADDLRWAADVALQRHVSVSKRGSKARWAYSGGQSSLEQHTKGCWGELAFCRGLGLEWPARVDSFLVLPDVDPFWEVRWSKRLDFLPVKTLDKPHLLVAFVTGHPPDFTIHGFITAQWAQQNEPLRDTLNRDTGKPNGHPCHVVNPYHLSPIGPGFHATHAWANGYGGTNGWICLYCGKEGQGDYARSGRDGAVQSGRVG